MINLCYNCTDDTMESITPRVFYASWAINELGAIQLSVLHVSITCHCYLI